MKYFLLSLVLSGAIFFGFPSLINAQTGYGSSAENYTCEGVATGRPLTTDAVPYYDSTLQKYVCRFDLNGDGTTSANEVVSALPLPPRLQSAGVWFVAILYALWGLAGIFFTGLLIYIGFSYMTSQGDPGKLAEIKKRLMQWIIGFTIVMMAYPILNTVFSFIGLNKCLTRDIDRIGFTIFFPRAVSEESCN